MRSYAEIKEGHCHEVNMVPVRGPDKLRFISRLCHLLNTFEKLLTIAESSSLESGTCNHNLDELF